ncbi:MAG: PDZ domain-containing protein [Myxococcales bacterium]|nr:PDZ domain-containing protein [Myxococcales bacterium]
MFSGSPAATAGLRPGHRIVGFERALIHSVRGLIEQVRDHSPGENIVIRILEEEGEALERVVVLDSISPAEFQSLGRRR